ncbi:hypothetical protein ACRQ1B_05875 [Rhizobium panacihumi]|uniref:hypothetical protein n=1 Tax=Rhizobium panacihumi TaxID=2008450 RepID=UPI003D79723B
MAEHEALYIRDITNALGQEPMRFQKFRRGEMLAIAKMWKGKKRIGVIGARHLIQKSTLGRRGASRLHDTPGQSLSLCRFEILPTKLQFADFTINTYRWDHGNIANSPSLR